MLTDASNKTTRKSYKLKVAQVKMTQKRRRSKSRVGLRKQERMKKAQVVIDVPSQNDTKKAQVVIDVSSCVRKKLRTDTEVRGANGTTV